MAEVDFNNLDNLSDDDLNAEHDENENEYMEYEANEYYSDDGEIESDNNQELDNIDEDQGFVDEDQDFGDDEDEGVDDDITWTDTEYILWLEESRQNDKVFEKYDKNTKEGIKELVNIAKNILGHNDDTCLNAYGLSDNIKDKLKLKKRTIPILTKYEKTLLISSRAQQIANGSEILIDINTIINLLDQKEKIPLDIAKQIAYEELRLHRIPFIIQRPLPNNTNEYWKVSDLLILD